MMNKTILASAIWMIFLVTACAQSSEQPGIIHLDDTSFKEKVFDYQNSKEWNFKGNKPVLVDFYTTWCGYCKKVAPVLEELQKEYGNTIQIYKIDAEKAPKVSAAFGVSSYPTFLFVPLTGQPQMAKGALPKNVFIEAIEKVMAVKHPAGKL